jgi:predicted dehydrogenase
VYIPLPIAYHAEWTIKALRAGKDVLVEKPIAANAEEARRVRDVAEETGRVVLEAYHWQYHPVNHVAVDLLRSGKFGEVLSVYADLWAADYYPKDDIRSVYKLGGGATMDLGYVFSAVRFYLGEGSFMVDKAEARVHENDALVDEKIEAEMTFTRKEEGTAKVKCHAVADLRPPLFLGLVPKPVYPKLVIELEHAKITLVK